MIKLHPIFQLREEPTEAIIELLESVTLGTNGAQYRHLDTRRHIQQVDQPLFLSLERNDRVLGNVTFCRRNGHWYIRYFAFDSLLQSGGKTKTRSKEGRLKSELNHFFDSVLNGEFGESVDRFYAYIDPRNAKSLWMSETLGFVPCSTLVTQTFSRRKPNRNTRVKEHQDWKPFSQMVRSKFGAYRFYLEDHTSRAPFYAIHDTDGNCIAFAKARIANWAIDRLPGYLGKLNVHLIPFIPVIRRLIQPKQHRFAVLEAVIVKDNDPALLTELYEGILSHARTNASIWWVDKTDALYTATKSKMNWGVLDKITGRAEVMVVEKGKPSNVQTPVFTSGFDFV